jgi:uncharacterized integral membrane protein (TIGR00697 family)
MFEFPSFSQDFKSKLLLGLFVSLIIAVNLLGTKITTFGVLTFSVGLFLFPFIFFITDIINEVFGKKVSREYIWIGLICQSVVLLYSLLAVNLPAATRFATQDPAYRSVFGSSIRIIIASLFAFIVSEMEDVRTFAILKKAFNSKYLWLRSGISTLISEAIDTSIFMIIAFHKLPFDVSWLGIKGGVGYDLGFIFQISWSYYLLKIALAWFGSPIIYLGVNWLNSGSKHSVKAN